jgi:hypothetical protein
MSAPSAKELLKAFPSLESVEAQKLADRLKAAVDADDPEQVDDVMDAVNEAVDGHGVESINGTDYQVDKYWMDTILLYVNLGDTYDTTLLYDTENNEFSIGSYGDFVEKWENEEEDDEEDDEEEEETEEDDESDGEESDKEDVETEEAE